MPKLSIIVPVHNVGPYLSECLEAIAKQTYKDYEVLIMENLSTDNSYEIAQQFSQSHQKFNVIQLAVKGLSNARNEGMRCAKGEYISIIDGDDFISPDFYEHLMASVETDKAIDMAIAPYYSFKDGDENYYLYDIGCPAGIYEKEDKKKIFSLRNVWTRIFKKEIINKYNLSFDIDLSIGEDFLFTLEYLVLSHKVAILDKGSYYYRVNRKGSLSTYGHTMAKVENMLTALDNMEKMLKKHNLYNDYKAYLDRENVQVIIGYNLGMSTLRELSAKEVGILIEPRKNNLRQIELDKNITSKGLCMEFKFYQLLLKLGMYRHYFKFIRVFRNLFLMPLRITLR